MIRKLKGKARLRARAKARKVHPVHNIRKRVPILKPELHAVLRLFTNNQMSQWQRAGCPGNIKARDILTQRQLEKLEAA